MFFLVFRTLDGVLWTKKTHKPSVLPLFIYSKNMIQKYLIFSFGFFIYTSSSSYREDPRSLCNYQKQIVHQNELATSEITVLYTRDRPT